jgi:hypothetical protein
VEDTVNLAALASCKGGGVKRPGEVTFAEERADAISDLEAGDPGACGDDGAGGIGARNQGGLLLTSRIDALTTYEDDVSACRRAPRIRSALSVEYKIVETAPTLNGPSRCFRGYFHAGNQEMRVRKNETSRVNTLSLGINKRRRVTSDS